MKIKTILIIVSVAVMSVLTEPTFVSSQQNQTCDPERKNEQGQKPTHLELCLCEQGVSGAVTPTYKVGESAFGMKPAVVAAARRKTSNRKRLGVAAGAGSIEWTQHTALLGSLEIPNADDSNSFEVVALKEELKKQRESASVIVERYWKTKINGGRTGKLIRCRPEENCEIKN